MKRVPAYQKDAYKVASFTLAIALVFGLIKHQMQVEAESYLWPINHDAIVLEKEVEKVIEVPRLPQTVEEEIRSVFGKDAPIMLKVAKCESGMNPKSKNKESTATGVFQIMASVHGVRRDWLTNQHINIQIAKALFDSSGLNPWNASRSCWGVK